MTITVKYSCDVCGLTDVQVEVRAREDEDVTTWMDQTVRRIARHHSGTSPFCTARTLKNLMIPITNADKIGGPSIQ